MFLGQCQNDLIGRRYKGREYCYLWCLGWAAVLGFRSQLISVLGVGEATNNCAGYWVSINNSLDGIAWACCQSVWRLLTMATISCRLSPQHDMPSTILWWKQRVRLFLGQCQDYGSLLLACCISMQVHTHIHAYVHAHIHIYICTNIHVHIHIYVHTHIYIYVPTYISYI